MKKGFKEFIIMLLLTIVIIILLILALFEYTPNSTPIMEVEEYNRTGQTVNTIQEITTSSTGSNANQSIIKSYSVSQSDLVRYVKSGSYDKKGGDPFAEVEKDISDTTNSVSGSTNSVAGKNNTTGQGYFNATGKNK